MLVGYDTIRGRSYVSLSGLSTSISYSTYSTVRMYGVGWYLQLVHNNVPSRHQYDLYVPSVVRMCSQYVRNFGWRNHVRGLPFARFFGDER